MTDGCSSDGGRSPALWGDVAHQLPAREVTAAAELLRGRFPTAELRASEPVDWRDVPVAAPRLNVPDALAPVCATDTRTRLLHARGRSYNDLVLARSGDYGQPPDVVARPRTGADVTAVLDWCSDVEAMCIPFGGGTSVVGGVTPPAQDRPVVTLQMRAMDRLLDVDEVSQAAHIQAGATGPRLEEQLQRHALTLRFYPQSFEFSTLGGWLATRAAGHYATGPTHIDEVVESIAAITPTGEWVSRRLPASGAGPSPDRLLLGSEGILGVITDAWVRVQSPPQHRAGAAVGFPSFAAGAAGVRAIVQAGLRPAGCRLLDPLEAALNGAGDGTVAVLVLAFESVAHPVDDDLATAVAVCRDAGGDPVEDHSDASLQWRNAFVRAPYLRDALLGLSVLVETFETATTWERLDAVVGDVMAAAQAAAMQVCGDGFVTCRITHAYPDGAAPYFTVVAPARHGSEIQQWTAIKQAASDALAAAGATITHHHAVGRDHRQWYDRQRPQPFARALTAAKAALDPQGMLNPGVLLDR